MQTEKIERHFKKGEIIHLDHVQDVQAFVLPYAVPYKNKHISEANWEPDLSDEHKMTKNVTVTITIKIS